MEQVEQEKKKVKQSKTLGQHTREWFEVIVVAYILAMFIRTFAVELYKIPTGSMIPTLIGGVVAEFDYDNDGDKDLVVYNEESQNFQVFLRGSEYYEESVIEPYLGGRQQTEFSLNKKRENDLILVNKFAYWFRLPRRGEIAVFKVPDRYFGRTPLYDPRKPVFIKRVVGLPGEQLDIINKRLWVNGAPVKEPEIFQHNYYYTRVAGTSFTQAAVGGDEVYVFGDNSASSFDSRAWGGVPLANLRGKAFFRYFPFKKISFLN